MKIIYKLAVWGFLCLLISSVALAENTNNLEETDTPETNQVKEAEEKIETIHLPNYKEIAREIYNLGSNIKPAALKKVLGILDLNNQKDSNKLFEGFLKKTKAVSKKGGSSLATRFKKEISSRKAKKLYGKLSKEESENFVVIYPENLAFKVDKTKTEKFDASSVLSSADSSFSKITEMLLMSKFIYWPGKTHGKIYVIPNKEIWDKIKTGMTKKQPVQTVISSPESREFFVLADKGTFQTADKAVAYAVAKAVLNEYSEVVSGERTPKFPQFFVVGVAATAAELDSVLTEEDGPQQLEKFQGDVITPNRLKLIEEKYPGLYPLPLYKRKLKNIKEILHGPYPSRTSKNEPGYYYLRQSKAVVEYLQHNGSLPFLILTKELADDEGVKKAFDGYVDLRDELLEKTEKRKDKNKKKQSREERQKEKEEKKAAEVCLDGYKEFLENAEKVVFEPLTYEYIKGEREEAAKERKSKKRSSRKRR